MATANAIPQCSLEAMSVGGQSFLIQLSRPTASVVNLRKSNVSNAGRYK
jgi:hypothetical protein